MFETLVNIFECVTQYLFIFLLANKNDNRTANIVLTVFFSAATYAFINHVNLFSMSESIFVLLEYALAFLYTSLISKDRFGRKLLISTLPFNTIGIWNILQNITWSYLLYQKIDFFLLMEEHRTAVVLLAQLMHTAIYAAVIFLHRRQKNFLADRDSFLLAAALIVCNIMTICFESVALHLDDQDKFMVLGIYAVLLFAVLIIYLFQSICRHSINEQKQRLELEMSKSQQIYNSKILETQKRLQELRHDMKHFIQALKELEESPDKTTVHEAIEKYESTVSLEPVPIRTPSKALDYVVNIKREEALQKDIDFIMSINLTHDIDMEDDELYLVLANLLDNAIEHIGMRKRIYLEVRDVSDMLMIRITNSVDLQVLNDREEFIRYFHDEKHGYGVPTVKKILENNGGFLRYHQDEGDLVATAMIPVKSIRSDNVEDQRMSQA